MRSVRWKQAWVLPLALVAAPTCGRPAGQPVELEPATEWSLTVINRHSLNVTVFVTSAGLRSHVGTVSSARTETYLLPSRLVGAARTVRLEASAIGSPQRATTDGLLIRPGQHVEWTLENGLDRSSVTVW